MTRARSDKRLGQYTGEFFKLPTLLGSRTNGRNSHAFLSNKGSAENDSGTRGEQLWRKASSSAQKGCVWDPSRSEKSVCRGEDLLKHIHHIKVNNEAEKGLSLTEVCRISMRTRDFLAHSLQWLDPAMAQLQLTADASGRVTDEEFVEILRPFTEGVLDASERHLLFSRLDGENKGFVMLELTESEHKKYEELKRMVPIREEAELASNNEVISNQVVAAPVMEEAVQAPLAEKEIRRGQMVASDVAEAPNASSTALRSDPILPVHEAEAMIENDEELRELECRLEELRSMQAERLRQRRKRELEAEIEKVQRELAAKTPKASLTPHATESASKVTFALPSTLSES